MPWVCSGQEAGLDRSLAFFEKDLIDWRPHPNAGIYTTLFVLQHRNQALWHDVCGGEMVRIYSDRMDNVISFSGEKNGDRVISVINFSDKPAPANLETQDQRGRYRDIFTGEENVIGNDHQVALEPWGYMVLEKGMQAIRKLPDEPAIQKRVTVPCHLSSSLFTFSHFQTPCRFLILNTPQT